MKRQRGWSRILLGVALGTACVFHAVEARAQGRARTERPWEVVVSLGGPVGGSAGDLEAAMAASGFGDTRIDVEHPFSSGSEITWAASIRRRIRPRLDVELIATRARMGSTLGYHEVGLGLGHSLFLDQSVTTIAPIVSYRLQGVHVGGGPAPSRVRVDRTDSAFSGSNSTNTWKVGLLLDAGVTIPSRSRLFFEGRGQYRWLPTFGTGPFESSNGLSGDFPLTMPAAEVDMSHAYFAVGMGARF